MKNIPTESCNFVRLSNVPISEEGKNCISESSNVTFGDANRTLFTISRLRSLVDFELSDDKILEALMYEAGDIYIDLEN